MGAAAAPAAATESERPGVAALWGEFKTRFGKAYADEKARFEIFRTRLEFIRETNEKKLTYKLGVNQFADMPRA